MQIATWLGKLMLGSALSLQACDAKVLRQIHFLGQFGKIHLAETSATLGSHGNRPQKCKSQLGLANQCFNKPLLCRRVMPRSCTMKI